MARTKDHEQFRITSVLKLKNPELTAVQAHQTLESLLGLRSVSVRTVQKWFRSFSETLPTFFIEEMTYIWHDTETHNIPIESSEFLSHIHI